MEQAVWVLAHPRYHNRCGLQVATRVLRQSVDQTHETQPVAAQHEPLTVPMKDRAAHEIQLKVHIIIGALQPVKNRIVKVEFGWRERRHEMLLHPNAADTGEIQ
eukprot:6069313-Prymnesium_polylepis.1